MSPSCSSEPFKSIQPEPTLQPTLEAANDPDFDPPNPSGGAAAKNPAEVHPEVVAVAAPGLSAANDSLSEVKVRPGGFADELTKEELAPFLKRNIGVSVARALTVHGSIFASSAAVVAVYTSMGVLPGICAYMLSVPLIAHLQRKAENMVHDVSHLGWSQKYPRLNDSLGDLLVAYPMMMSVRSYRYFHRKHHNRFGGVDDPCLRRITELGETLFKGKPSVTGLLRYIVDFYKEVAQEKRAIMRMLGWHFVAFLTPMAFFFGWTTALVVWLALWAVPQFSVLPILRAIGEYEEHDYGLGDTEAKCTITNDGILHRFIHPCDRFHWAHHAYKDVPEKNVERLHRYLLVHSKQYRDAWVRKSPLGKLTTPNQEGE